MQIKIYHLTLYAFSAEYLSGLIFKPQNNQKSCGAFCRIDDANV